MKTVTVCVFTGLILPEYSFATQMHQGSEGIIVHQMGHVFFLFSMVSLLFTITGKGLGYDKGWRLIQYSAFFFILWNLDALAAHFLDNQIHIVKIKNLSMWKMSIETQSDSSLLTIVYYLLKLDHLLCVPAMIFLYRGLGILNIEQKQLMDRGIMDKNITNKEITITGKEITGKKITGREKQSE